MTASNIPTPDLRLNVDEAKEPFHSAKRWRRPAGLVALVGGAFSTGLVVALFASPTLVTAACAEGLTNAADSVISLVPSPAPSARDVASTLPITLPTDLGCTLQNGATVTLKDAQNEWSTPHYLSYDIKRGSYGVHHCNLPSPTGACYGNEGNRVTWVVEQCGNTNKFRLKARDNAGPNSYLYCVWGLGGCALQPYENKACTDKDDQLFETIWNQFTQTCQLSPTPQSKYAICLQGSGMVKICGKDDRDAVSRLTVNYVQ